MLSVENLKVVYRGVILALDGVSLEVGRGGRGPPGPERSREKLLGADHRRPPPQV